MSEFAGKNVLVTGTSSGIGWHTAKQFAAAGAKVVGHYNHNREGAETLLGHGVVAVVQADLSAHTGIPPLEAAVARHFGGRVDVLVNNAGSLVERKRIAEMDETLWDRVMDVNLKSVFLVTRAFLPGMLERKAGAVVNVASIAGRHGGGPGAVAYATTKGALITFTKGLSKECGPSGVRANAVNPGVIDTPFHEQFSTPAMLEAFRNAIPMGRLGKPEEIADVILFLASARSSFLSGECIEINGGQLVD
jgi:NAD(P)-dependent dehydrogenase (short-subunit alcohol dehydrogenase family)